MKPRLYYLGKPEDGFGWGVANTNLIKALGEFCEVIVDTQRKRFDAPTFVPIADHHLNPLRKVRSPRLIGYCFTEWPLSDQAKRNARQYDVLFAGSNWNVRRLFEKGIKAEVLHQGIDFERFKVQSPSERKGFVVFSGGKYEFRKGQDYVVAAMHHFMRAHPDVILLAAWHNQWPQSAASMHNSWLLEDWQDPYKELPPDRVFKIPAMKNEATPALYAQAHIGLFPNRCEAGTNLVMCEFMACGRPVISSYAHGHADVLSEGSFWNIPHGTIDPAGWFNCYVSDLLSKLESAYKLKDELPAIGRDCRSLVEKFTWRACAEKLFRAAFPHLPPPAPAPQPPAPAIQ